jgi:hypothetical protein
VYSPLEGGDLNGLGCSHDDTSSSFTITTHGRECEKLPSGTHFAGESVQASISIAVYIL